MITADFFLEHETQYTQRPDGSWTWECACGEIVEERFRSWEECRKYTSEHWAEKINATVQA